MTGKLGAKSHVGSGQAASSLNKPPASVQCPNSEIYQCFFLSLLYAFHPSFLLKNFQSPFSVPYMLSKLKMWSMSIPSCECHLVCGLPTEHWQLHGTHSAATPFLSRSPWPRRGAHSSGQWGRTPSPSPKVGKGVTPTTGLRLAEAE